MAKRPKQNRRPAGAVPVKHSASDAAVDRVDDGASFGPASLRGFDVELQNFTGPFDLLLRLIARKELELTEVALASVTDEFLQYIREFPDLSSATDFLVVAATLISMKSAALLPGQAGENELADEDLEARDLLFARLLQYRAFQELAAILDAKWGEHSGVVPRAVPLQPPYTALLPELKWTATPADLKTVAQAALFAPAAPDEADHVARPAVSFDEQLALMRAELHRSGRATFAALVADAGSAAVVVTRFLAVLELYRRGKVSFQQPEPMGPLEVTWGA